MFGTYRPIFIGVALVALFFAWRRIYRPSAACANQVSLRDSPSASFAWLIFGALAVLVLVTRSDFPTSCHFL